MKKNDTLQIRTETQLRERLKATAKVLDIPASQIVREAISEKLARLAETRPELRKSEPVAA